MAVQAECGIELENTDIDLEVPTYVPKILKDNVLYFWLGMVTPLFCVTTGWLRLSFLKDAKPNLFFVI